MKKLACVAGAAALALSLAGCEDVQKFEDWYTSPTNQATILLMEKQSIAFVCDVSAISNVVAQVGAAAQADASFIGTTGKVYAASTAACTGLGGLVGAQVTAPVGASVLQ